MVMRNATRRRLLAGIALCLWAVACSSKSPTGVSPVKLEPERAIHLALTRFSEATTLRSRFHATAVVDGSARDAEGVLIVSRPDQFRLRLFSSFGLSFFDYVERGGRAWAAFPGVSGTSDPGAAAQMFAPSGLGSVFLGRRDVVMARCAIGSTARCRGGDGDVEVDLERAVILSERRRLPGGDELSLEYSDYRVVDGLTLPFRIVTEYPARKLSLRIDVSRYEVNPTFPAEMFTPPAGATLISRDEAPPR